MQLLARGEKLRNSEFVEVLGVERKALRDLSHMSHPHPVVFDITEESLYIESKLAQEVFQEVLNTEMK